MAVQSPTFGGPQRGPEDASLVDFIKASSTAGPARQQLQRRRQLRSRRSSPCTKSNGCLAALRLLVVSGATQVLAGSGQAGSLPPHCTAKNASAFPSPLHPRQISSKEEPRHYSAKIAWNARNNSHMPLLATGAPAINCAIKVRRAAVGGPPRAR